MLHGLLSEKQTDIESLRACLEILLTLLMEDDGSDGSSSNSNPSASASSKSRDRDREASAAMLKHVLDRSELLHAVVALMRHKDVRVKFQSIQVWRPVVGARTMTIFGTRERVQRRLVLLRLTWRRSFLRVFLTVPCVFPCFLPALSASAAADRVADAEAAAGADAGAWRARGRQHHHGAAFRQK